LPNGSPDLKGEHFYFMASEISYTGKLIEVTGSHLAVFEFDGADEWSIDVPVTRLTPELLDADEIEIVFRVPEQR
jgi:hypothetical protein